MEEGSTVNIAITIKKGMANKSMRAKYSRSRSSKGYSIEFVERPLRPVERSQRHGIISDIMGSRWKARWIYFDIAEYRHMYRIAPW